jgi:hypothetical protein
MATVFAATVATRWFVANRGVVTGMLTAASATGTAHLPARAQSPGHRCRLALGRRHDRTGGAGGDTHRLVVLRDDPADLGLLPYGAPSDYVAPERSREPIRTAFRALHDVRTSGAFWLLFGSFFICGLSTNGLIQTHFISAAHDHNINETTAASLLALVGVFDVIGTIGSGWLTDRVDPRRLLFAYYALRGLSLMVLDPALDARNAGLWTFMVFYGLDWVATVPPTVALCNQQFGRERGAVVYGWVFAGHQIGAALMGLGCGQYSRRYGFVPTGVDHRRHGLPHRRGGDATHLGRPSPPAGHTRERVTARAAESGKQARAAESGKQARAAESGKHGPETTRLRPRGGARALRSRAHECRHHHQRTRCRQTVGPDHGARRRIVHRAARRHGPARGQRCGQDHAARHVLGLHRPDEGALEVFGLDPMTAGANVRERLGYSPEHHVLPADVQAFDLVRHIAELHGLPRRDATNRASDSALRGRPG